MHTSPVALILIEISRNIAAHPEGWAMKDNLAQFVFLVYAKEVYLGSFVKLGN